jgi:hypothetical protein
MTIHEEINNYLAADLHDDLSEDERNSLHSHLVECADCRQAHQETKAMNKVLEEKFAEEKPDRAFENRVLMHFRNRIPNRRGAIASFIVGLARRPALRIAATALVVLLLIRTGQWLIVGPRSLGNEELVLPEKGSLDDFRMKLAGVDTDKIRAEGQRAREIDTERTRAGNTMAATPPLGAAQSKTDVYRRDLVTKLPASTVAGVAQDAAKPVQSESEQANKEGASPPDTSTDMAVATAPGPTTSAAVSGALANRKLIRNATVVLEIISFDQAVQKITAFASEEKGYVATTSSEKQENGKLKGEIVVKVLPENLDRFLQKIRGLGELKNQTLGTEDITKNYFDTESRLKNARVMEQRLIDMLKKKSEDINDLLQVEKELGRVREEIEKMQGDLKFWDSQVQFATVTISLAEKDLEAAAKYLLKERAQLALYTPEVEKIYNDLKALASSGGGRIQITNAQLDRDNSGRVSARVSMLIAPEESDGVIANAKAMGRVENFQIQTERIAQGGEGMSENANTKRDKVELNITISRDEQEQAFQQTTLRIRTSGVDEKAKRLRELAEKQSGRVRNSSFSRDPEGREYANVSVRVPMKNYNALMQSLDSLGKVEGVSVQRQDRNGAQIDEANAPADLQIQVYSQGDIVSSDTGLIATLRRTIGQSAAAIMWSLRMIGVAIAFLAPWVIAIVAVVWIVRRIRRRR